MSKFNAKIARTDLLTDRLMVNLCRLHPCKTIRSLLAPDQGLCVCIGSSPMLLPVLGSHLGSATQPSEVDFGS